MSIRPFMVGPSFYLRAEERCVATRADIEATYGYMDEFWRLSLGQHADITCAFYDGNYHKTLEQAQLDKHEYILQQIQFSPGARVLDIGCGWGGFLRTVTQRGGRAVGLTLCERQAQVCSKAGIEARLTDWNDADPVTLGPFDAIVCVGAFDHFCSEQAYVEGSQSQIYHRFFAFCHRVLRSGGRLFLQTMTWGSSVPDPARITLRAPRHSDEYRLAVLREFYPGSWLPTGLDQIKDAAAPYFSVATTINGRQDYIRTMQEWGTRLVRPSWPKVAAAFRLLPYFLTDPHFPRKLEMVHGDYHLKCFQNGVMDHERITLQWKPA